ncbi:MAG: DNA repair protein RecO [Gemmataceae bacterium]|nr:DNA repair protein RecO [Gemmataceae bacterium]
MAAEAAIGLVIGGSDWSESSRIVTLFTREWGKVRALAKGGRRLRSNFEIAFDLLTVCRVMVIRKSQGGLDLLTEARVEERFSVLRRRLAALYVGYYMAELLTEGTQEYDPHPALFDRAVAQLRALEQGMAPLQVASEFELAWLAELGYRPRVDACAVCGGRAEGEVLWSPSAAGMVCRHCRAEARGAVRLTSASWQWLQAQSSGQPAGNLTSWPADLRAALSLTVTHVLGRRPKMLRYVDGPS